MLPRYPPHRPGELPGFTQRCWNWKRGGVQSVPTHGPPKLLSPPDPADKSPTESASAAIGSAATTIAIATVAPVPSDRFLLRTILSPIRTAVKRRLSLPRIK